eukprot:3694082-Pyramimonas_sp.AAC.1
MTIDVLVAAGGTTSASIVRRSHHDARSGSLCVHSDHPRVRRAVNRCPSTQGCLLSKRHAARRKRWAQSHATRWPRRPGR